MVVKRRVRSVWGAVVMPAWTGPGWTMADLGAVSQRKRSPRVNSASGPAVQASSKAVRAAPLDPGHHADQRPLEDLGHTRITPGTSGARLTSCST
jgi:hypothetical protein